MRPLAETYKGALSIYKTVVNRAKILNELRIGDPVNGGGPWL